MKVTVNPSCEKRNWLAEMKEGKSIQPSYFGRIVGDYVVSDDNVIYLDNGRTVFSQPEHKKETLASDNFYWCLGVAGQNEGGNYLGHIFPGLHIVNKKWQIVDNEVTMLRRYREKIVQILANWRDDGLGVEDLGIFGGRVWQEGAARGYLEGLHLLGELGKEVFGEEPKVIGLPTKGMLYGNSAPGEEPQTVFVGREGVLIHTESPILEHPITIGDVSARVAQILS